MFWCTCFRTFCAFIHAFILIVFLLHISLREDRNWTARWFCFLLMGDIWACFFNIYLLIMLLQLSHFFLLFIPLLPAPPLLSAFPFPLVHVHGRAYKFFGFSISYTILTSPYLFCTIYASYSL